MTYEEALVSLKKKDRKKLQNNTYLIRHEQYIGVKLHETEVLQLFPDKVKIFTGGWKTVTTKDRINNYLPNGCKVWSSKRVWYVYNNNKLQSAFYEGATVDYHGNLLTPRMEADTKRLNATKKQIGKFCNLLDVMDKVPQPELGDCWYCLMKEEKTGRTMGDISNNHDHLIHHMEEGYIHGSLLVNAMREKGYTDKQISYHYGMAEVSKNFRDSFKRALRSYLMKRL